MTPKKQSDEHLSPNHRRSALAVAAVGALLVLLATLLAFDDKTSVAAVFATIGSGALVLAPLLDRLEGAIELGPVKLSVRAKAMAAVKSAPVGSLMAALPLLEGDDVKLAIVPVPPSFAGKSLVQLPFLRQDLQIAVIATRPPGQDHWTAGGKVSDVPLASGTELLVTGEPAVVDYFATLSAVDKPELWERVGR